MDYIEIGKIFLYCIFGVIGFIIGYTDRDLKNKRRNRI